MKKVFLLVQNFSYENRDSESCEYDASNDPIGLYSTERFAKIAGELIGMTSYSHNGCVMRRYHLSIHEFPLYDEEDMHSVSLDMNPNNLPEVCVSLEKGIWYRRHADLGLTA